MGLFTGRTSVLAHFNLLELLGDYFYKKSKLNPLVNPVAISILIVSGVLIGTDVSYERYFNGAKFIHFMLGPATVALAIPIYKQINLIKKESGSIFISLVLGSLFAMSLELSLFIVIFLNDFNNDT